MTSLTDEEDAGRKHSDAPGDGHVADAVLGSQELLLHKTGEPVALGRRRGR